MVNNAYQKYKQNSIETASSEELTLMLYQGCIKFIKLAKRAIEENNILDRNTNLIKAQNIVQELMISMDPKYPITETIMPMYDYMYRRLMEANAKNDIEILNEVEGYAVEFRDTWKQVMQINRGQQAQLQQSGKA
ncbi:flagellar export chaperone FliS [Bacillus solimangrovi]|uniref:Flagellar secretion chaperone FliS n=1 Tax=Bacillus solimangrovi TaxID=1305675 RepID=A0A1E5LDP8_9BACI|nr:flagellar export chaperone FliS [Bacillus solimangrovi]